MRSQFSNELSFIKEIHVVTQPVGILECLFSDEYREKKLRGGTSEQRNGSLSKEDPGYSLYSPERLAGESREQGLCQSPYHFQRPEAPGLCAVSLRVAHASFSVPVCHPNRNICHEVRAGVSCPFFLIGCTTGK